MFTERGELGEDTIRRVPNIPHVPRLPKCVGVVVVLERVIPEIISEVRAFRRTFHKQREHRLDTEDLGHEDLLSDNSGANTFL